MQYRQFEKALEDFPVFSLSQVLKLYPAFRRQNLVEWQAKGYVVKIINTWYRFADLPLTENLRYRISNCLRRPSYISLESAFSFYGFIPEAVYAQMAVTTQSTIAYHTQSGDYYYRSLQEPYFFGYTVLLMDNFPTLMAELEKAVLDFIYLNPRRSTLEDFKAMRFDLVAMQRQLNWKKMDEYAQVLSNRAVQKRIAVFKKMIDHAHTLAN